jgi:hypothetical protein
VYAHVQLLFVLHQKQESLLVIVETFSLCEQYLIPKNTVDTRRHFGMYVQTTIRRSTCSGDKVSNYRARMYARTLEINKVHTHNRTFYCTSHSRGQKISPAYNSVFVTWRPLNMKAAILTVAFSFFFLQKVEVECTSKSSLNVNKDAPPCI